MSDSNRADSQQVYSDRAMARLLAEALRQPAGAPGDSACPDAEILAAYAEHNLDAAETVQWEKHFADCTRCQKILAVLTVSEEPLSGAELERFGRKVAAVEVGAPAAATRQPKANVTPFERPRTAWRWLAPALGVAAAAVLWIALRPIQRPSSVLTAEKTATEPAAPPNAAPEADSNSSVAAGESLEARANVPAPPAEAERQAEQQQLKTPVVGLKKEAQSTNRDTAQLDQVQKSTAPQLREEAPKPQSEPVLQAANEPQQNAAGAKPEENANTSAKSAVSQAPAASPPAPAPPPASATDAAGRVTSGVPALAPTNSVSSTQAAPPANAQAEAQGQGKTAPNRTVQLFAARQALAGVAANSPNRIVAFTSPSVNVSWRVGPQGLIQRSTDRGQSWQPQASGVTSDLLGGAAPSDKIAWIAGRAGVILRTTDGEHWQRITSPEPSADWAAVQAADALRATITSTDQRRFATEDGGQSWKQQ